MRRIIILAGLLLPLLGRAQTAVKVYTTDTVQSSCALNAANAACVVAMAGKSSVGFVVTAVSSPSGITLVAEQSRDGTNWEATNFQDTSSGLCFASVANAALAVGYGEGIAIGNGVRSVRVRASAWTSGSATVAVAATDSRGPASCAGVGLEARGATNQPTAATEGNFRAPIGTLDGAQYARLGGPVTWTCSLNGIGATLTQCQAAPGAGLSLYVSWVWWQSTTTTAGTGALQYGTGTNCGTGTTALLPASGTANRYGYPASSTASSTLWFPVPLKVAANNALCAVGVVTNTLRIDVGGYTAP